MSAEKKIEDNTSKEVLSDKSKTVQGDIYVQDVHKYFGVTKALNGVNFNANFGEIHAIVGGNGCGKSTLAKTMSGVLPVDKGKVSILGQTPTSPVMARNMGIATVFQEVMIAEESSVVDNLFVGSDDFWYKNLTQREKVLKAQEIMEDLVGEYVDPYTQAFNLSLPIKAWITIARAFLRENTKLLILDESSAALDFDSTERLFKKMRELRDNGVAVFIVTHRIAELVRISDKATVMRDGKDVGVLEKKDLNEKNLIGLMTGRAETGEKSKSASIQTKTDKVVMRAENLVVWPDSKPVNFEVKKGEMLVVMGLSGSGKSTLLRCISRLTDATGGKIFIEGQDLLQLNNKELIDLRRNKMGMVFQSFALLPHKTVVENIAFPLQIKGIKTEDSINKAMDMVKLVGLDGRENYFPRELSGGQQQRVGIARSLAVEPDIWFLDEPFSALDPLIRKEMQDEFLRLQEKLQKTIMFITHDFDEALKLADRIAIMKDGIIEQLDTPANIVLNPATELSLIHI